LGEQMSEFMAKGAIDFIGIIVQARIQGNQLATKVRAASAAP
jgi:hypothetical protein